MAHFTQEMKAQRAPAITKLAKEYGVKVSMKIDNGTAFVVTLLSGSIDFMSDYNATRKETRWYQNPQDQDYAQLSNHCNFNLHIGKWNKYYIFNK